MDRVFIDTSAWVALFLKNDEHHKKATILYERLKASKAALHTSDYVVDETITHLLHRGGHRLAVSAGEALFSSGIVAVAHIDDDLIQNAWKLFKKYDDKSFSFTDVTSFVLAKELGIKKAFAFDDDFKKAGMETIGI